MSAISCFNISILSGPNPQASPLYLAGSSPVALKTLGWIIPAPAISNQPVPEQILQPLPWQNTQRESIPTPGSTKG